MIDIIQVGLEKSKSVRVVSSKSEEIGDAIQSRLGRGVTYTQGRGGFSNESTEILNCVINRMEENKLVSIIKDIDEGAFVVISDVSEVRGGNFKKNAIFISTTSEQVLNNLLTCFLVSLHHFKHR